MRYRSKARYWLQLLMLNLSDNRPNHEAIFFDRAAFTWVGRPSLKSYEGSIFAPSTFCTAIFTFVARARALQSRINAGFEGIHAPDTRSKGLGGKSGIGTILHKVPVTSACAKISVLADFHRAETVFSARADTPMKACADELAVSVRCTDFRDVLSGLRCRAASAYPDRAMWASSNMGM